MPGAERAASTVRLLLAAVVVIALGGCASAPQPGPGGFLPLPQDPRVRHEAGAEIQAEQVAALLPEAIRQVETTHQRPFAAPVLVHVCGSDTCFRNHVTRTQVSAATVPVNRVILAPRLFGPERHRLAAILTHELSHQHLGQQIGHYTPAVPVWFHEGFATLAANGGGADYATDEEAIAAVRAGRMFDPAARDSTTQRHLAEHFQLSPFVFYRQAMLFLRELREASHAAFSAFIGAVQDGEDFATAFATAYNTDLADAGARFAQRLRQGTDPDRTAHAGSHVEP